MRTLFYANISLIMNNIFKKVSEFIFSIDAGYAIFFLALIFRLVFLWQWSGTPYFSSFNADAWVHDRWAMDIAGGAIIRHTAFYQSPLYPYVLALFYKIFGHHYWPVYIAQAIADSFSCLFILKAARLMFNRRVSLISGLIAAFYAPFILNSGLLLKETLAVFCVSSFLFLFLKSIRSGSWLLSFGWGAALGAASLSRPNITVLFAFAALWLIMRKCPSAFSAGFKGIKEHALIIKDFLKKKVLPALLGLALFLLPSALHNYMASDDFVLFNYAGGFVFYLGSNPYADGTTTYPPWINSDPEKEQQQVYDIAEAETGRKLKPSEVSAFWLKEGLKHVRENPRRFFWLTLGKLYLFWNKYEIPDNYDISFIRRHFPTVASLPLFGYGFTASLGVFGLFLTGLKRRGGILPALFWPYMLSLLPFLITDRYRMPALVFLIPAAAYAINRLYVKFLADAGKILPALMFSLPFFAMIFLPSPSNMRFAEAAGYANLSCKYAKTGEYMKAVKCFEQSEALDPDAIGESEAVCAAYSYNKLGNSAGFMKIMEKYKELVMPEE